MMTSIVVPRIKVAIADERVIVRWALRQALSQVADLEVVGDAGTVEDTLAMLMRLRPDVVVLDLSSAEQSGLDLVKEIGELERGPFVVTLAAQLDAAQAARAIRAGAHGYVAVSAEPEELLRTVRAVSRGEQVMPPGAELILATGPVARTSALTNRELQVMEMLARGMTSREIAEHLEISVKTIDTHRGHVLKKLGLRNNSDLTRFAVKHGYVTV